MATLTDSTKNEDLTKMLENIYKIDVIRQTDEDESLKNLKYELLLNADKITKISSKLIEQLRRFIDDRVWIENKKILELCKSIEKTALNIKTNPPTKKAFTTIDDTKVALSSVFEKSLYTIKQTKEFKNELKEEKIDINLDTFYDIFFIDEQELKNNINYFLQIKPQCTLKEILEKFPITKGISEIVSYLSIAKNSTNTIVELDNKIEIKIKDINNDTKIVKIPKIVFTKGIK